MLATGLNFVQDGSRKRCAVVGSSRIVSGNCDNVGEGFFKELGNVNMPFVPIFLAELSLSKYLITIQDSPDEHRG